MHAFFMLLECLVGPVLAQQSQRRLLVDRDVDASTGCTVAAPSGPIADIEFILTADVSGSSVVAMNRQECNNGSFSASTGIVSSYAVGRTSNDRIFVYAGTSTGALTLLNGQHLIGQGANAPLTNTLGFSPPAGSDSLPVVEGTRPVWSHTAGILTVGNGNTVHAIDLGNSGSAAKVRGNGFGALTISRVALTGNGQALDLSNGSIVSGGTLDDIVCTSSSAKNIKLDQVNGTVLIAAPSTLSSPATGFATLRANGGNIALSLNILSINNRQTQGFNINSFAGSLICTCLSMGSPNTVSQSAIRISGLTATGITSLSITSLVGNAGTRSAVELMGNLGAVMLGNGAITGFSGTDALVHDGSGTISGAVSISNPEIGGRLIEVRNRTGGSVVFAGASTVVAGGGSGIVINNNTAGDVDFSGSSKAFSPGANPAIALTDNSAASITFSIGGLTIITTSGVGFSASGGGNIGVSGIGNSINSGTGSAVSVANTTVIASGLTFQSISADGASNGAVLSGTGINGGLTVTGTGSAGRGGTGQNSTDDALRLTNTASTSLDHMIIRASGNGAGEHALDLSNSAPTLIGVSIDGSSDHGININGGSNIALNAMTVSNAGNATNEHAMNIVNLGGLLRIDGSTLETSADDLIRVTNSNFDLGVEVRNASVFRNTGDTISNGNNAIVLIPNDSSAITASVLDSSFVNVRGNSVLLGSAMAGGNGNSSLNFDNNQVLPPCRTRAAASPTRAPNRRATNSLP